MNEKILVVNNDPEIRKIASMVLSDNGYETFEGFDGVGVLDQAIQIRPDLILLDVTLPEMERYELCQALKKDLRTSEIPVIFSSVHASAKDIAKGLEIGAVDFISSMTDHEELLARVQMHLSVKSLNQALIRSNWELIQKQKHLDEDLLAAAEIQKSFLPSNRTKIKNIRLASSWVPANTLGGDIFNVLPYGDKHAIFYMIDVNGHDVPSALVTISVSQYIFQQSSSSSYLLSPKEMLTALNFEYPIERFNRYFTIFYLHLNLEEGKLTYSSAGHPPAILLKKNGPSKILNLGGMIIGLSSSKPFEEGVEVLENGDKVIIYTDGIEETRNVEGEFYGTNRFLTLLEILKEEPLERIINAIHNSLKEFRQTDISQDDISIIGFEFNKEKENEHERGYK